MTRRARTVSCSAVALMTVALMSCAGTAKTETSDQSAVGVILDREDVGTPPSKDKFCRYAGRMITGCEFQIILDAVPDPEANVAVIGKAYAVIQRRERARHKACVNSAMAEREAAENWSCLESLTNCAELPRCVGDAYRAPTSEKLRLEIVKPR